MPAMRLGPIYFREWRRYRGLTQEQVVQRLSEIADPEDVEEKRIIQTAASLSRVEKGVQAYNPYTLAGLAAVYDCEEWELIGRDPFDGNNLIKMLRTMPPDQQMRAAAVIEGLMVAEDRLGYRPADPPGSRLGPPEKPTRGPSRRK